MSQTGTTTDVQSLPQYISQDNLFFQLFEVFSAESLHQYEYWEGYDRGTIEMTVQAAAQLADTYLFPHVGSMDREGCRYENGRILAPEALKEIIQQLAEGGWIGATAPVEIGGLQMPSLVYAVAELIFNGANNAVVGYCGLTAGAARLIYSFGEEGLVERYVSKLIEGKWQGTMALTEPQAGSSLSDITTKAIPAPEGHYLIEGQKIFISSGDHDAMSNVVHLMLARIEGAPAGTKGISLFVVPRQRYNGAGELEDNDVQTAGIFHKMGQKAYSTAHLMMGEKDNCHGYLVGKPNQGLRYMFQMMNAARVSVGIGGAGVASAAYYASLRYALERPQGRPLNNRDLRAPQTLIIHHADVRRMLFLQKAIVEGSISLILQSTWYQDMAKCTEGAEKMRYEMLFELLTPIVKTYPCEAGIMSVNNGLQVLGGYGFLKDYPLEQYYRDIRIMPIYEGTTGIQSQDLLGRKIMMNDGQLLQLLMEEIQQDIEKAMALEPIASYAQSLQKECARIGQIIQHLIPIAMEGDRERFLADANLFMECFSLVVVAWQWLKQGIVAQEALNSGDLKQSTDFYESKIHTMAFYYAYELVKTKSLASRLMDSQVLTLPMEEKEYLL